MLSLLAFLVGSTSVYALTCHCFKGSHCDTNGFCAQGCEQGWFGPGCQVGNVALGRETKQSTTFKETTRVEGDEEAYVGSADRAVDGSMPIDKKVASCTHAYSYNESVYPENDKTVSAWWVVTLDTTVYYVISNVTLVNQRVFNGNRHPNFVILYSNDTKGDPDPNNDAWHECARENGTVGYNRTYTCNNHAIAKRVAIYLTPSTPSNSDAILTLCEVQIYGYEHHECPSGFTGPGCLLRACDRCSSTGGKCAGDFGSCHYAVCPDQSLLPPDCWITLSNFSGLTMQSRATCNSMILSPVLPDSKPNIAATLLQLEVTTSADRQLLENATLSVRTSNPAYYNFSSATSDTTYDVSVEMLYCDDDNSKCFHTTGKKVFTIQTGKREYVFSRNSSCVFIDVSSMTPDCELPSAIQVNCEAQSISGVTVNSSGLTTCGLERDLGYRCSMAAFFNANTMERRIANISAEPLSAPPMSEANVGIIAGSIGGFIALIVIIVAIVAILYCRRQRKSKAKPEELEGAGDANENIRETAGVGNEAIVLSISSELPNRTSCRLLIVLGSIAKEYKLYRNFDRCFSVLCKEFRKS